MPRRSLFSFKRMRDGFTTRIYRRERGASYGGRVVAQKRSKTQIGSFNRYYGRSVVLKRSGERDSPYISIWEQPRRRRK